MNVKGKLKKIDEGKLPIYEIFINEDDDTGMDLISVVENPAIQIKGFHFSEIVEFTFKQDEDKQIIVGPALIPNVKIKRQDENTGELYYVFFSKETIEKMVQKFNKFGSNRKINLEHTDKMVDAFIMEDWIVEDTTFDKSRKYGFELPVGSYMIKVKIEDKKFWEEEVKGNGRFGFSIQGLLGQQLIEMSESEIVEGEYVSYNDYPKAATENAKIALRWAEENGWGSCGTPVGKIRANQLANGESISEDTISRMASFERHRQNSQKELGDGCGRLMWLAWGGDEGIEWAQRKLKQIKNEKLSNEIDSLTEEELSEICNFIIK